MLTQIDTKPNLYAQKPYRASNLHSPLHHTLVNHQKQWREGTKFSWKNT